MVRRSFDEKILERVRAYRETEPYRKALPKPKVWVEPFFGEAKEWHGMRRFRLRGLGKVNSEAIMIASGQNLKQLVTFGPRGPNKFATTVALRPPEGPSLRLTRRHRTPRRSVFQQAATIWEVHQEVFKHHSPGPCAWSRYLLGWRRCTTLGGAHHPALSMRRR